MYGSGFINFAYDTLLVVLGINFAEIRGCMCAKGTKCDQDRNMQLPSCWIVKSIRLATIQIALF